MKAYIAGLLLVLCFMNVFGQKKRAEKFYGMFDYSKAIPLYKKALTKKRNTGNQDLMLQIAESYRKTDQASDAATWYANALAVGPFKDPAYYIHYGQILRTNEKYEEAKSIFQKYLAVKPNDAYVKTLIEACDFVHKPVVKKYKIENVASINTPASEFGPVMYKDGMVFASDRRVELVENYVYGWTGKSFLDLFYAHRDSGLNYGKAEPFQNTINTAFHEATATFTNDGNTVYFTRVIGEKKLVTDRKNIFENQRKIFSAKNINDKWKEITPFKLNSDQYSVGHPCLTQDGKRLYFASDMPGGFGGTDIYYIDKNGDEWGVPVNMGPVINTGGRENFPFVDSSGKIYFASDGHPGYGGLDIIVAVEFDGKLQVHNPGLPINSSWDDFALVTTLNADTGFFSSNRKGGKGGDDIYFFSLDTTVVRDSVLAKKTEEPEPVVIEPETNEMVVDISLFDKVTGDAIQKAEVYFLDNSNIPVRKFSYTEPISIKLPKGISYYVKTLSEGYIDDCYDLTVPKTGTTYKQAYKIQPASEGEYTYLDIINYDYDKYNIRPDAAVKLEKLRAEMKKFPGSKVQLSAHTDRRGSFEYNERLSKNRAQSAKNYLVNKGIASERINIEWHSKRKLKVRCGEDGTEEVKQTPAAETTVYKAQYYKVQIIALLRMISPDNIFFKNFNDEDLSIDVDTTLNEKTGQINYHYVTGSYKSYPEAVNVRKKLEEAGYKGAFIVPYYNGQRIKPVVASTAADPCSETEHQENRRTEINVVLGNVSKENRADLYKENVKNIEEDFNLKRPVHCGAN